MSSPHGHLGNSLGIALVIGELNLLLQILAGLLVAKVIAGQFCLVQLVQNLKLVLLNKSLGSSAVSREGHARQWPDRHPHLRHQVDLGLRGPGATDWSIRGRTRYRSLKFLSPCPRCFSTPPDTFSRGRTQDFRPPGQGAAHLISLGRTKII